MADINERVGVVETKVANLDEKLDDLKGDVKDMHDCLDKTRDTIKGQLDKMYDASCDQHAALNRDIKELKKVDVTFNTDIAIEASTIITVKFFEIIRPDIIDLGFVYE